MATFSWRSYLSDGGRELGTRQRRQSNTETKGEYNQTSQITDVGTHWPNIFLFLKIFKRWHSLNILLIKKWFYNWLWSLHNSVWWVFFIRRVSVPSPSSRTRWPSWLRWSQCLWHCSRALDIKIDIDFQCPCN
jgi:hypothetical protein